MCYIKRSMQSGLALPCPERTVGKTIDGLFAEHQNSRIIIAPSHRTSTVCSRSSTLLINTAVKLSSKAAVWSIIISIAQELGYINIPEKYPDRWEQMKTTPASSLS